MYCPVCLTGDSRVIETTKLDDMTLRYRECKKL
nr:MAG TPA_asm: TniQ [Caudoviricetes sp.]